MSSELPQHKELSTIEDVKAERDRITTEHDKATTERDEISAQIKKTGASFRKGEIDSVSHKQQLKELKKKLRAAETAIRSARKASNEFQRRAWSVVRSTPLVQRHKAAVDTLRSFGILIDTTLRVSEDGDALCGSCMDNVDLSCPKSVARCDCGVSVCGRCTRLWEADERPEPTSNEKKRRVDKDTDEEGDEDEESDDESEPPKLKCLSCRNPGQKPEITFRKCASVVAGLLQDGRLEEGEIDRYVADIGLFHPDKETGAGFDVVALRCDVPRH